MKLILHIGTEKTGTTTTQRWGAQNREALARQGVRYSQVLGRVNHAKLYLWCLAPGRKDKGFRHIKASSDADLREFRAQLPDEFAAEVSEARKAGCHTFVISNEHCHSRLVSLAEVQRAREFLAPHFDEIEVLCSLRPQIDLAVSMASNIARESGQITRSYFDKVGQQSPYYNYKALVERWSIAFGAEKLTLVPFRRTPDFVDVIAAHARIDTTELQPPIRSNEAIDVRVMAMTNAMNAEPMAESRWIDPFAYIPHKVLQSLPCEQRLQPGLKLARSVHARFDESNRKLTDERKDIGMADLEPDWSRYKAPSNLKLLERPCAFSGQLAALVQLFNQNIALARAQNEIVEGEGCLELNRPFIAQRRLKEALRLLAFLKQAENSSHLIGRLEARAAQLAKELEDSPDSPSEGFRGGKRRGGRGTSTRIPKVGRLGLNAREQKSCSAEEKASQGESRAFDASASEDDLS